MSLLHRKQGKEESPEPTLTKTRLGTNDDGSAHHHYHSTGHVVITGPITGTVTVADGTTYDVSDSVIQVASAEHAAQVAHAIGDRHEAEGHPHHTDPAKPFRHTPMEG